MQVLVEHGNGLCLGAQARVGEFQDGQHGIDMGRREYRLKHRQSAGISAKILRRFDTWRDFWRRETSPAAILCGPSFAPLKFSYTLGKPFGNQVIGSHA